MARFGRTFPLPRRGVRVARPLGVTVALTATRTHADAAASAQSATLTLRYILSGRAGNANTSTGVMWVAPLSLVTPFDGIAGTRVEQVRFEVLDAYGNLVNVVHPTVAGNVQWSPSNRIARTLNGVRLDPIEAAKLTPGVHRIRPVWTISGYATEYPLGVFLYLGGDEQELAGGTWVSASPMPDRAQQLVQKLSDSLNVTAATILTTAFATIAASAGFTTSDLLVTASGAVIGATPLAFAAGQSTRMDALNALTDLLGYLPPYFDNLGRLVARPVPVPNDAWPDRVYTTGQNAVVIADTVKTTRSLATRPNVYLVRSTSPTNVPVAARYDIPSTAANALSVIGYEIVETIDMDGLNDSTQALAVAKAQADRDASTVRTITFTSLPDPRHDGWNIVEWQGERMLEVGWSLDLQPGGAHTHTLASVYS